MSNAIYNYDHQGFRQYLAGKWFRAAYPDPDNLNVDPDDYYRFSHPSPYTLTVEWFRYLRILIAGAWSLDQWPGASDADKTLERDLCEKYERMKVVAEAQGFQFDENGNIKP